MPARTACLWLIIAVLTLAACGLPQPAKRPEGPRVAAGVTLDGRPVGSLVQEDLATLLQELAAGGNKPAVAARFADQDGRILPETAGHSLDGVATIAAVLAAPPGTAVAAVYRPQAPAITANDLRAARRLGATTTPILDASPGRLENIRLTAALVNNAAIGPGQEFSFNRRTGDPTADRGFQPAPVFIEGGSGDELGGGMCQVSSTLHSAVLAAGLPVTERHPHSRPVAYIAPGLDAATYTDKDLRFRNSSRRTVILRAFITGRSLVVDLWALPGDA
jgi:vancomycin resistance protein YoaR